MKKYIIFIVAILLVVLGVNSVLVPDSGTRIEASDDTLRLIPGKTLRLTIPQFLAEDTQKRVCEVRIPESYSEEKKIPLLVWFAPGRGSNRIQSIPPIVDRSKYLLAALPYPDNKLPRLAIESGTIDHFWEYEQPMLEYIRDMIPNIDPNRCIAAGFSSGAHLIGSGLDRGWQGFTDFFTVYILHEGGYAPEMRYSGAKRTHRILVTYGLQSDGYGKFVVDAMRHAGITPDVITLPHTGHAMSQEAIDAIKEWIEAL